MIFKKSSQSYLSAFISAIITIIIFFNGWYLLTWVMLFVTYLLYCDGGAIDEINKENNEFNEFYDISMFKLGMPIKKVVELNKKYFLLERSDEKNTIPIDTCPSCGAHLINGKCDYCGYVHTDNTNITRFIYKSVYGLRIFEFNEQGKLVNFKRIVKNNK